MMGVWFNISQNNLPTRRKCIDFICAMASSVQRLLSSDSCMIYIGVHVSGLKVTSELALHSFFMGIVHGNHGYDLLYNLDEITC